jgi:hypothetical protein
VGVPLREVFPESRHQRDWVHKARNVLDALPKSVRGRAKKALTEIAQAENKTEAKKAMKEFEGEFGVKWPKTRVERLPNPDIGVSFRLPKSTLRNGPRCVTMGPRPKQRRSIVAEVPGAFHRDCAPTITHSYTVYFSFRRC